MASAIAHNRKLPADDVIRREYYDEGLTGAEIARRHGVDTKTVHAFIALRGWPRRAQPASVEARPRPALMETADKIVRKRQALAPGRDLSIVEVLISLPRIPTLHGHFQGA